MMSAKNRRPNNPRKEEVVDNTISYVQCDGLVRKILKFNEKI